MSEISLKRSMKRITVCAVCITVFLFVTGFGVAYVYFSTLNHATEERMHEELHSYKQRIQKQVERNFETLRTVAGILSATQTKQDEVMLSALQAADAQNSFLMFMLFDTEGNGAVSMLSGKEGYRISMDEVPEAINEIVLTTLQGEAVVSDALTDDVVMKKAFVFSVPIYRNGEIIGALLASDAVDVFSEELEDQSVFYGRGYMHLVDSEGKIIIHGNEGVVDRKRETILESPYLTGKKADEVKKIMGEMGSTEFLFDHKGEEYNALLEPVGINGWYLFGINSSRNVNQNIYALGYAAGGFFLAIVVIFFFVLAFEYRTFKKINEQLRVAAYYDRLTTIFNFSHFRELAKEAAAKDEQYAIIVMNIRQFKFINEIFGKDQADKLLKYIGKTVEKMVAENEYVCRESADFFYLFLRETNEERIRERIAEFNRKIIDEDEHRYGGYRIQIRYGIAISGQQNTLQDVMEHAMFALAKTKKSKYLVWFFDAALHEQEKLDNYVESHAQVALENNEFRLFLQPKKDLSDNTLEGAEALVRWEQEDGTMLSPGVFIPLFEANGFCSQLDMYMFEKVCRQLRMWIDAGYEPLPISINQSKITFYEENYEDKLRECLEKYQIDAALITLEILESFAIENVDSLNKKLDRLKEIGFRISMDDFGTGYSSLNTLGRLKIDEVKLDRGFLMDVTENISSNMYLVMEEIIKLSKKLSISTVIEGIETEQNEKLMKKLGCDIGQGYLYSKPVSAEVFTTEILLKSQRSAC